MPEITTFRPDINSIYVNSFGEVTLDMVQESLATIAKLLQIHDTNQLIFDVRKQEVPLELVDTFTLTKQLAEVLPKDLKMAYLVTIPAKQPHYFFTLMANCFGCPVQSFYTIETAVAWFEDTYDPKANPFNGPIRFPSLSENSN